MLVCLPVQQDCTMDRIVAHFDFNTFFVSVERLKNSALIGKPVIVGGGSDRGVVASCSYEARKFGVSAGMPMRQAKLLCPEAIIVRGDYDAYSRYSDEATTLITELAPVVEKASIDEHYLDLTGMDKFLGTVKFTRELKQRIEYQFGLPISFGLAVNKTVSKIADGEAKGGRTAAGEMLVQLGTEKPFLAPLSVRKIPGVGDVMYRELAFKGINKILTLQQLDRELMERGHGKHGLSIWQKANAIDPSPVVPFHEQKSMSKERTYEKDTTDIRMLYRDLAAMVQELAFGLRAEQRLAGCVTVKIRYSNFDTHTEQGAISYTSLDEPLTAKARALFDKLYQRRMLIRLIGVKFSKFVGGSHQIDLFTDSEKAVSLYQAMDALRRRYGPRAVVKATTL